MKQRAVGFYNAVGLGAAIVYTLMFTPILPVSVIEVDMALSDGPKRPTAGIRLLRAMGDDDRLLEMCYRQQRGFGGNMFDSMIFDGPVSARDIRGIYYRVTGKAFNAVPPPPVGFLFLAYVAKMLSKIEEKR